jgi:hypothetical protein
MSSNTSFFPCTLVDACHGLCSLTSFIFVRVSSLGCHAQVEDDEKPPHTCIITLQEITFKITRKKIFSTSVHRHEHFLVRLWARSVYLGTRSVLLYAYNAQRTSAKIYHAYAHILAQPSVRTKTWTDDTHEALVYQLQYLYVPS